MKQQTANLATQVVLKAVKRAS